MTPDEEKLALLDLDAERAWQVLDATHRHMPDCEHNQAWKADIAIAQENHRRAIAARDRQRRKMARLDDDQDHHQEIARF